MLSISEKGVYVLNNDNFILKAYYHDKKFKLSIYHN